MNVVETVSARGNKGLRLAATSYSVSAVRRVREKEKEAPRVEVPLILDHAWLGVARCR